MKLSNNFRHFSIRNFEISKYRSFYISPFQNLTLTRWILSISWIIDTGFHANA